MRCASGAGMPIARATSLMTLRALSFWNVRDLTDALLAVLLRDVADDLVAPRHAEVDVEVGHAHALRIQEALEQQVVAESDRAR